MSCWKNARWVNGADAFLKSSAGRSLKENHVSEVTGIQQANCQLWMKGEDIPKNPKAF